ncbi:DUF4114 domain-containing protein [Rosistilla oblonga]|uniref:Bifunctional hemolysin/adenylate cyclase n=1 Tax=Rosistilla oblonga TaxID=2527990 RepID=A0A518ITN6_9BACT|nr:DUF4114 domain-containing protein [Rosistilla oblonga]QDV56453.1 Bifunctional hemolysin/adenylate cyclase precursor [Rosistilla oblonga]
MNKTIKNIIKAFSGDTTDNSSDDPAERNPWVSDLETVEPMVLMSASPLEGIDPAAAAEDISVGSTSPVEDQLFIEPVPISADLFAATESDDTQDDLLSDNSDSPSTNSSVSTGDGVAQDATIAVSAETGVPGQPIDVVISAQAETGDQIEKVELSGLPTGAKVQVGDTLVQPIDGKVDVDVDKLDELQIVPPTGSADDFDVTISVTTIDGNDSNVTQETFTVEIDPSVDVNAADVSGNQGDAIDLKIDIDSEAADHLFTIVSGLPENSTLAIGDIELDNNGGQTLVQRDQLKDLKFVPADDFTGKVDLKVTALVTDSDSDAAVDLAKFSVDVVAGTSDGPDDGVEAAQLNAVADTAVVGEKVDLTINAAAVGDDKITAVTLENLPGGARVEAGGFEFAPLNGKVVLDVNDFSSVKIVPPAGSADDFDITVRVTTTDGGVSRDITQVVNIDIDPDLKVTAVDVTGTENSPIDLNLKVDTQAAAQTTVVIKGLPDGSSLVSGGDVIAANNGEALVRVDQLDDLALNPAAGFSGTVNLTAKVVAVDNDLDAVSTKANFSVEVQDGTPAKPVDSSTATHTPTPPPTTDTTTPVAKTPEPVVAEPATGGSHSTTPAPSTTTPVATTPDPVSDKVDSETTTPVADPSTHTTTPVAKTPEPVVTDTSTGGSHSTTPAPSTTTPAATTPDPVSDKVDSETTTPVADPSTHTTTPVAKTPEPVVTDTSTGGSHSTTPAPSTTTPVATTPDPVSDKVDSETTTPAPDPSTHTTTPVAKTPDLVIVDPPANVSHPTAPTPAPVAEPTTPANKVPEPVVVAEPTIVGTAGADKLNGNDGADHIDGGAGNDTINGGDGNDKIDGGEGNDRISGGAGDDVIEGGAGNDIIDGNEGNDTLTGGEGSDTLRGGKGNDVIDGSDDTTRDTLNGDNGDDKIIAGKNDVANGGAGDDVIVAKAGNVKVNGGAGNDTLDLSELPPDAHKPAEINVPGGVANVGGEKVTFQNIEKVIGTTGDDNFSFSGAENGNKFTVDGGDGHNTIDLSNIPEKDITIADGKISINTIMSARDGHGALTNQKMSFEIHFDNIENVKVQGGKVLDIEGEVARHEQNQATDGNDHQVGSDIADTFDAGAGDDKIEGGAGNDKLNGGDGNDVIDGGAGNDVIDGGKGNDNLSGGDGNDKIDGGEGNDHIEGGAGADTLNGGDGNDKIDGGDGNDRISGGAGDDVIEGGAGNDIIDGNEGNDTLTGGEGSDTLRGGAGNDVIDGSDDATRDTLNGDAGDDKIIAGKNDVANGGAGDDVIVAKAGNVKVNGGAGNDTLDLSELPPDAHKPAEINVPGGVANVGGEKVTFQNIEKVIGTTGDDNFSFSGAENGDKFTVDGGDGHNTIDLSNIPEKDITIADGKITINTIMSARDGHGALTNQKMSFEIHFDNVENVKVEGGKVLDIEGEVARHEQNQATDGNDHQVGSDIADTFDAGAGDDKIEGGAGNDKLSGGDGNDHIDGGAGNDVIDGGKGNDTLVGGDGNDKIEGGDGNDHIDGGAGVDTINGGDGNDKIDGGNGNDRISGGAGDDVIEGGAGNDIIDGNEGNDTLTGGEGSDTLRGGAGNDVIDGSDDATRDTLNGDAGDDKIIAGKNDVANGGAGDDVIIAKAGNVKVNGGAGNDTLDLSELPPDEHKPAEINVPGGVANVGGEKVTFQNIEKVIGTTGDDNFSFSGAENGDKFTVDGGDGHNTIDLSNIPEKDITIADGKISINTIMSARDGHGALTNQKMSFEIHFDNVESIKVEGGKVLDIEGEVARHEQNQATDGNDHQVGSDIADTFHAGAGDDKIEGGAGNDKLSGGDGNDVIDGGKGNDVIDGGKGNDTLVGGDGNDKIEGGEGNDHIEGGAGADTLNGGDGNDKIDGGEGNDRISGGAGDDVIEGGAGNDVIDGNEGNDTLTGGEGSDTLRGGAGNDVIDGSDDTIRDTLNGDNGDDKIIAGKNDVANGGAGDDVIVAKAGNVKVNGGAGNDTLDLSELPPDAHKPAEINVASGVANVGGEKVTFQNIEKVIGTTGDDNFSFSGAENGDKFTVDGGDGHNTIDLSNIPEKDITIADGKITINTIMSARDGHGALTNQKMSFEIHFDNVENVKVEGGKVLDIEGEVARHEQNQATDGNDHQVGSDIADVFDAGAGDDKIEGGAGNDKLNGGDGNDVIDGGKGNDVIDGGKGNDNLSGGDGNDKIEGGDGADHIDGGAGVDTINGGDGNDKIDGGEGNDRISGGAGDDVIEGGAGNDVIDGNEGNDTLTGGEGSDTLRGGAGNDVIDGSDDATRDTLNGDAGDDKIIAGKNDVANGGAGDDVIVAKAGNVKVNGGAGNDTLDLSELPPDTHKPAEINVPGGVANVGGEKVTFQNIEKVIGTTGDDNFSFSGAENGDKFTVDGGDGHNTIDLSNIPEKDITIADGKISINTIMSARDGHGALTNQKMSFEIHFDNVENVKVEGGKVLDIEGEVARHEQNQATDGNDHQVGSDIADTFDAGAGDDKIEGGAGNDKLSGGDGNDVIDGGKGNDVIDGGKGNDNLSGSDGNDKIEGGDGNDHIDGGAGVDTINGGDGNDKIDGGDGNDRISGGAGDDVIEGGAGNDIIDGNEGNDTLTGGEGSDTLRGGKGNDVIDGSDDATRDTLNGDNGDDKIIAGKNDIANGGAGDDVIVAKAGGVKVNGGAGNDTLDLSELPPDAHKPADINVASGVANVGGEKVTFQNIEKVIGTTGDDNFSFSGAENGDKFTVDGGDGHNTIDLSNIPEKDITIADGKISINTIMSARDGHGALTNQKMSFEIHFDNIENVKVQGGKILDIGNGPSGDDPHEPQVDAGNDAHNAKPAAKVENPHDADAKENNTQDKVDTGGHGSEANQTGRLDFVSEGADFNNVIGTYELDAQGKPTNFQVLVGNTNHQAAGTVSNNVDQDLHMFVIANGSNFAGAKSLDFDGHGGLIADGRAVHADVFFSDAQFNLDGKDHFRYTDTHDGGTVIGIEDLKNLGDRDFNDAVLKTNFRINH